MGKGIFDLQYVMFKYLINYFLSLISLGIPITPNEIKVYQELTGLKFNNWEINLLFEFNVAYQNYKFNAKDINCPNPLSLEIDIERETIKNMISQFKNTANVKRKK